MTAGQGGDRGASAGPPAGPCNAAPPSHDMQRASPQRPLCSRAMAAPAPDATGWDRLAAKRQGQARRALFCCEGPAGLGALERSRHLVGRSKRACALVSACMGSPSIASAGARRLQAPGPATLLCRPLPLATSGLGPADRVAGGSHAQEQRPIGPAADTALCLPPTAVPPPLARSAPSRIGQQAGCAVLVPCTQSYHTEGQFSMLGKGKWVQNRGSRQGARQQASGGGRHSRRSGRGSFACGAVGTRVLGFEGQHRPRAKSTQL